MRILHITTDNKFISQALQSFEDVYPGKNEVWMLTQSSETNASNNDYTKFSFQKTLNPLFSVKLLKYDLVVLHTISVYWYLLMASAPRKVKFAWLGWGGDYCGYIYKTPDTLLLDCTLKLKQECEKKNTKKLIAKIFKKISKWLLSVIVEHVVLRKIGSFSPVLYEDYELIKEKEMIFYLPPFIAWNYGSLEENFIKNFVGERVGGNNVLVGNNASFTNNHVEVFNLLRDINVSEKSCRSILVPLSYGDECYKKLILRQGNELLGDAFEPLENFMPIENYVAIIRRCGFVIFNHIRQQGVGNIVIMLYLGARVFLRKENPVYHFLKKEGVFVNAIQELSQMPELLRQPLTEDQIQHNIQVLYKHWSREVINQKTKNLVEFHLGKVQVQSQ